MSYKKSFKTIVFSVLLVWLVPAWSDSCSGEWICARPLDHPDGSTDIMVENLRPMPVTITLRVRSRNLKVSSENPVTMTIPPEQAVLLTRMEPRIAGLRTWYRYNFDWTVGDQNAVHDDSVIYRLPYAPGTRYRVLQGYGSRFSHTGLERYTIDFKMSVGTPVHAARGGVVAHVVEEHDKGCWDDGCGKFANFVTILHDDDTTGEYYHLAHDGALVAEGDRVEAGQLIALSGNTGHTTMPHLHFGVYRASHWGATESVPVRFRSADEMVTTPRRGRGYTSQ